MGKGGELQLIITMIEQNNAEAREHRERLARSVETAVEVAKEAAKAASAAHMHAQAAHNKYDEAKNKVIGGGFVIATIGAIGGWVMSHVPVFRWLSN